MEKTPQLEDGYVRIAIKLFEQLPSLKLSPSEWQVLMLIIRKTYGWQKKSDSISLTQMQKGTGLTRQSVVNGINKLVNKRILVKDASGYITKYAVNKLYTQWIVNKHRLVNKNKQLVNKRILKLVNKRRHTKDKKDTNTKEPHVLEVNNFISLFNQLYSKNHRVTNVVLAKYKTRRKTYSADDILKALTNSSFSKFNHGDNDRGWKADPEWLLRNDDKIDKWLNTTSPKGKLPNESQFQYLERITKST